MKINAKMLVYILSTSMIIFILSIGYVATKSRQLALEEAHEIANKNAHEYANYIKSELASDFNVTKTLAQSAQAYQTLDWDEWIKIFLDQQMHVITENPHYLAVATSWELNHIDPNWEKSFGRYLNGWVRDNDGNIKQIELQLNTEGDDFKSNYYAMKSRGHSMIVDPAIWSPTGKVEDQYINTNFSVPIILGNTFIGIAGLDVDLQKFREVIQKIKPFEQSYAFLMSNNGTYVAHPNFKLTGELISNVHPELNNEFKIIEHIQSGESFSFTYKNENNQKNFYAFAPIIVEGVNAPWSLAIVVPNKVITSNAKKISLSALLVIFIGLLFLTGIIWLIARNITNPIIGVTEILKSLAKGKIDESLLMEIKTKDEIGEMTLALNTSIQGLNKKAAFANQIGSGNIDHELDLLSEEDQLGHSLLHMRQSLLKAKSEEEKRKVEDQKRQWINEGLAKFAEILRKDNNDLDLLANEIIKNLVYYLNVNQGGLFILNEQNGSIKNYELLAAFAFDREKFIKKNIELGEGLVGTCAKEKNTIHLTEVPQDYINVTSGLGEANPNSLLIVPLIIENEVLGVIELASFKKFKKHEVEFTEKVAESIGSTLKSVRINTKTSFLLEQSQQQAEEMSAQEEEMRQNMEELQATQEESTWKGDEFRGVLDSIDKFLLKAEFNLDFKFVNANDLFLKKFKYKMAEVSSMEAEDFVADRDNRKFHTILNTVMSGKSHQEITFLKDKNGNELELLTSFAPVFINEEITKILILAMDLKDYK
ncbi:MAG: cache domain-containing protein [Bacteroidales bacterium]|jgi:methyl-accepting chemotaxis protein|nr:cache domain-containing protein [Bacteroidales bacterium]